MPVEPYPSKQYATTNHSHGNPTLALTNLTGTTASASNGLTLSLSAAAPGGGGVAVGAGTQTATSGTVVLSNANGITFGMSGSSAVTASHNALTTARASNDGVGLNTAITAGPVAWTVNSNGISLNAGSAAGTTSGFTGGASISGSMTHNTAGLAVSLSHPAWLTTAMPANATTISNVRVSAGTTSNLLSALTVADSNGVSFGINGSTLTATVATTYAGSNHTHGNPTLALTNLTGTTASASNGLTISLSAAAPGAGGGIAAAAGTQTATSGTVAFANGNGITFGMSNSNQITASHNGLTTAAQSDHSHGNPTLALTNISGTTASASNGLTLSLSAGAPGGGVTVSSYSPPWAMSGMGSNSSLGNSTLYFVPFDVPQYLYASRINFYISVSNALSAGNSTGTCSAGIGYAIYTLNSVSLSRLTSYSAQIHSQSMSSNTRYAATHYIGLSNATSHSTSQYAVSSSNATTYAATSLNGQRMIALPVGATLTPGRYWLGMSVQTVTGNAMTNNLSVMVTSVGVQPDIRPFGVNSAATNASVFRMMQGWGSYSAQSAAWPNSIAYTTDNIRAAVNQTLVHFQIAGVSTNTNYL